jgi:hypothetical protein
MKLTSTFFGALCGLLCSVLYSCADDDVLLPTSTGAEGEIMLIVDDNYWRKSPVGDTLRNFFQRDMPGLPQDEPMFRLSRLPGDKFRGSIRWHRNIFIAAIDPQFPGITPTIAFKKNIYAKSQRLCRITAAHPNEWLAAFRNKQSEIEEWFRSHDIEGLKKRLRANPSRAAQDSLHKRLGISMLFPHGFNQALARENLCQFSYHATRRQEGMDLSIQKGVVVARLPYLSETVFTEKGLIQLCDSITSKIYEGSSTGSVMVIEHRIPVDTQYVDFSGNYAMAIRGLWRMSAESRGGPFLAYLVHNAQTNDLIFLHGFVFAAGMDKRNHILQMEAMLRSAEWK